jgi:hypothetical protein
MEITRNQWYLAGLVLLFLGIEFRLIETVELTPEFTQFLAERSNHPLAAVGATTQSILMPDKPVAKKSFQPPEWIGWSLLCAGLVLVLHSWALPKPAG